MEHRQQGGIGFLLCNAALFANGLIAHAYGPTAHARQAGLGRMASAALWSGSALFLTRYGARPVHAQQQRVQEKLAMYLRSEGVPLDAETLRKADAETRHGWHRKLEDFLYAHPLEYENAYNAVAAGGFAVSGALRRRDGHAVSGNANLGMSGLQLAGNLASILIPEKTAQQVTAQGQAATWWGAVQQAPMRYTRALFIGGSVMTGVAGIGEYRAARQLTAAQPYRAKLLAMSGLSMVAMVVAIYSHLRISGSKKASGDPVAHDLAQHALVAEAARHIAAMPEAEQQQLARAVADYLCRQPELRFSDRNAKQVAAEMLNQVPRQAKPVERMGIKAGTTYVGQLQQPRAELPIARR